VFYVVVVVRIGVAH